MKRLSVLAVIALLAIAIVFYIYDGSNSDSGGSLEAIALDNRDDLSVPVPRVPAEPIRMPESESMASRDLSIAFGNAREVTVTLRQRPRLNPYFYPTERLIDIYFDLEEAALSGESAAAIQLYQGLKRCNNTPTSRDELDRILTRARDEGIVEWRTRDQAAEPAPVGFNYNSYETYLEESFMFCDGIAANQSENYLEWVRLAAESGEFWGTRFLTEELGDTEESFVLWQQAWEQGHINAATALLLRYRAGNIEQLGGQPDYITTYAFQLIRNKITQAAQSFSANPNSSMLQAMDEALHATRGYLSPREQELAENLAADMIEANPNCCIGNWRWRN